MAKRKKAAAVFCVATFLVSLLNTAGFVADSFFYTLRDLPQGKFLYASMSPNGDYTLKIYQVQNDLGVAVRGELIRLDDENLQPENIYWEVDASHAIAGWLNESVVSINDTSLNVSTGDTFDSRRKLTINQIW